MQVLEASSLSCPRCTEQLTVDLNAAATTAGSKGPANPRRGNKAGTVCVAGKVKVGDGQHEQDFDAQLCIYTMCLREDLDRPRLQR
jgi:hypothetical protein